MPINNFESQILQYVENAIRYALLRPMYLGGVAASGGGAGSPPGGFIGYLPQTRVAYDYSELETLYTPASGMSLVDNLNHIRARIAAVEASGGGGGSSIDVYENDALIASGITILNFEGSVDVVDDGGGQVTITVSGVAGSGGGSSTFLGLTDTPSSYAGQAGKVVAVAGTEDSLEFTTISGVADEKVKVSSNDTTNDYLENKLVAGSNVGITVLNEGGNEQVQISATVSGVTASGWYRQFGWETISGGGWTFVSDGDNSPMLMLTSLE